MREGLPTPFLIRGGALNSGALPFRWLLGTLGFCFDRNKILSLREESRILGVILHYRITGDTHHRLFILAELNLENEMGIEVSAVEKVLVPENNMVNCIVLPNYL